MFKEFHSDSSGTIQILVAVCMMVLALLAALVFNTANQTQNKIAMQNAADASLISGSKWMARGLNIVSADNVGMTQVLAMIITLRAMDHTFGFYNKTQLHTAIHNAFLAIPFVGPAMYWAISANRWPADLVNKSLGKTNIVRDLTNPPGAAGKGYLWYVMDAFQYMSDMTYYATPVLMELSAWDVAAKNGAEGGILFRAGQGLLPTMPIRRGSFTDICKPTKSGSPLNDVQILGYRDLYGYRPDGKGTLYLYPPAQTPKLPFWFWAWAGAPLVYDAAVDLNYSLLCGGAEPPAPPPLEVPVAPFCQANGNRQVPELEWEVISWTLEQRIDCSDQNPERLKVTFNGSVCPTFGGKEPDRPNYSTSGAQDAMDVWRDVQNKSNNTITPQAIDDRRSGVTLDPPRRFTKEQGWTPQQQGGVRITDISCRDNCDKWEKRTVARYSVPARESEIRTGTQIATVDSINPRVIVGGQSQNVAPNDWFVIEPDGGDVIRVISAGNQSITLDRAVTTIDPSRRVKFSIRKCQTLYTEKVTQWTFIKGKTKVPIPRNRSLSASDRQQFPYPFLLGSEDFGGNSPRDVVLQSASELTYMGIAVSPAGLANARILGIRGQNADVKHIGRISADRLRFPNPSVTLEGRFFTYGQSRVYNPTSWDTFTQNWHTKLVRSGSMEAFFGMTQTRNSIREIVNAFNKH